MKQNYIAPQIEVIYLQSAMLLCASPNGFYNEVSDRSALSREFSSEDDIDD